MKQKCQRGGRGEGMRRVKEEEEEVGNGGQEVQH